MSENIDRQTELSFRHNKHAVKFVETMQITEGVECDTFEIVDDSTRDIAVIRVTKGFKTPLQKVLKGDDTLEIFASGEGELCVWSSDSSMKKYIYRQGDVDDGVNVRIGEKMQWLAGNEHDLIFYEVCTPPYEDGRFENLD